MTYYNTTHQQGDLLEDYHAKAGNQDEIILSLFKRYKTLSPSQTLKYYPDPKPPITSIRRSITNLTDNNILIKTGQQRQGQYGRPECVWSVCEKT